MNKLYFPDILKKLFLVVLFGTLISSAAGAQTKFGNEWIDYSQTYYKIKVAKSGLYRLDYTYLSNAGLSAADPRKLQLWRRGQQVAIQVEGEADGTLNPGDFVEFYGERNDGKLDREIYKNPANLAHEYYSLYTDTAAYFLTVGLANGKRMEQVNIPATNLNPELYHQAERLKLYVGEYQGGTYYGESLLSWGDASEGYGDMWFGTIGSGVRSKVKNFEVDSVLNIDPAGRTPMLEVMVEGVLRDAHDLTMTVVTPSGAVRDLEKNIIFSPWGRLKKFYPLQLSDIAADGKVKLRFTILDKGVADIVRVRYLRVTYSRKNEYTSKNIIVSPDDTLKNIPSLFNIKKNSAQTLLALEITDPYTTKKLAVNNQDVLTTVIAPAPNGHKQTILFTDQSYIIAPAAPIRTTFRNLAGTNSKYLFIYHKRLAASAANGINPIKAYADYRASAAGGQYDTLSLEIGKIYDQFHYGEKSANAVRHLIHYLRTVGQPAYVLLLGKALLMDYGNFGRTRSMPTPASIQRDMVPTGFPASDIFLLLIGKKIVIFRRLLLAGWRQKLPTRWLLTWKKCRSTKRCRTTWNGVKMCCIWAAATPTNSKPTSGTRWINGRTWCRALYGEQM